VKRHEEENRKWKNELHLHEVKEKKKKQARILKFKYEFVDGFVRGLGLRGGDVASCADEAFKTQATGLLDSMDALVQAFFKGTLEAAALDDAWQHTLPAGWQALQETLTQSKCFLAQELVPIRDALKECAAVIDSQVSFLTWWNKNVTTDSKGFYGKFINA